MKIRLFNLIDVDWNESTGEVTLPNGKSYVIKAKEGKTYTGKRTKDNKPYWMRHINVNVDDGNAEFDVTVTGTKPVAEGGFEFYIPHLKGEQMFPKRDGTGMQWADPVRGALPEAVKQIARVIGTPVESTATPKGKPKASQ